MTGHGIVISTDSFDSGDDSRVVHSNVTFVNALFDESVSQSEVSADALRSYYVDFFQAQLEKGGFVQFAYSCGWNPDVVVAVREGLTAMGAVRHLTLYDECAAVLDGFGEVRRTLFFEGQYTGPEREILNDADDRFFALSEDLTALNAAWLRAHPQLRVLSIADMSAEVATHGTAAVRTLS